MSDQPTWEDGPWLVERRVRYRVTGCSSETARRAVVAYANGFLSPSHDETMPTIEQLDAQTSIFPEGDVPFTFEELNEGDNHG